VAVVAISKHGATAPKNLEVTFILNVQYDYTPSGDPVTCPAFFVGAYAFVYLGSNQEVAVHPEPGMGNPAKLFTPSEIVHQNQKATAIPS
jgi:hypothetical protein